MKTRTLQKPYGYKPIESYSKDEEIIKKLGLSYVELLNYQESPIIDYYRLSNIDDIAHYYLDKGQDITPIISIADWSDHTFKNARFMNAVIEKSPYYQAKSQQYLYNLSNAQLLLENFLIYSINKESLSYQQQVHHEVLPDFCERMIYAYNYHDSVNNKKQKELALSMFQKTYELAKEIYHTNDDAYWTGRACKLLANTLCTRKKINLSHPIVQTLLIDIEPHIQNAWSSYGSMIMSRFFEVPLRTQSFDIVEYLVEKIGQDKVFELAKNNFYYDREDKHSDKYFYYLEKNWDKLSKQESIDYTNKLFKINNDGKFIYSLKELKQLMSVITPLEKVLKLFEAKYFFSQDIKNSTTFQECYEILHKRSLFRELHEKLPLKEIEKKIKI